MLTRFATALLAASLFVPSLSAQGVQVFGGPDQDRKATWVVMFGENVMAGVAINYSAPQWKDEYTAAFDKLKGKNLRLGKNWWTSLDTSVPLEIGGVKVGIGSYFLGLHCDEAGKFSLLVLESGKAMKSGFLPFNADAWVADITVPLTFAKDSLKETVEKMVIDISADKKDPTTGTLSLKWGKSELSAPVKYTVGGGKTKDAAIEHDTKKK